MEQLEVNWWLTEHQGYVFSHAAVLYVPGWIIQICIWAGSKKQLAEGKFFIANQAVWVVKAFKNKYQNYCSLQALQISET